jgi:hypothetical protein
MYMYIGRCSLAFFSSSLGHGHFEAKYSIGGKFFVTQLINIKKRPKGPVCMCINGAKLDTATEMVCGQSGQCLF